MRVYHAGHLNRSPALDAWLIGQLASKAVSHGILTESENRVGPRQWAIGGDNGQTSARLRKKVGSHKKSRREKSAL
jgi:hypothetical protein